MQDNSARQYMREVGAARCPGGADWGDTLDLATQTASNCVWAFVKCFMKLQGRAGRKTKVAGVAGFEPTHDGIRIKQKLARGQQ